MRLFRPGKREKAWEQALLLMNHLTLYGGQSVPSLAIERMRARIEVLRDTDLNPDQIAAVTEAILAGYEVGREAESGVPLYPAE